jgi:sterol desaturase/sphingolipid hydroxylase (fatty acid hydroxylase superfamily)
MRPVSWVVLILVFFLSTLILVYGHAEVRAPLMKAGPLSPIPPSDTELTGSSK